MPDYPKEITTVRDALLVYVPSTERAEAIGVAVAHPSPVVQIVGVFDALKADIETLDVAGLKVLAGCASLVSENAWFGKGAEAFAIRDAAVAALDAA